MSTILLTGGCGFIGSHIAIELLLKNTKTIIVDDFSNSDPSVLQKVKSIVGETAFKDLT
ncbi:NAD-dependent epimerase/dehydratase family protein, partial [bacterium]|nr:NAD-dependent epimerase/dehydratase family protein [bacterium]